jgi:stearoyl-CoA desaturase (delta-9 desaturase)
MPVVSHSKHHARVETVEDPHSPQIFGIKKVLWEGAELYRQEAGNRETIDKYGLGTPDDWLERHLYSRHDRIGISLLLVANFVLFGCFGITLWAVQMAWIPFFAAGVINGIGHYWGYRTFQPEDTSTNIVPWGILVGGEELHNNHHAYASSARFSIRWYEFDIGWQYIRALELLGLAQVKKVAPDLKLDTAKTRCDLATVQAVITHRYEVLAKYAKSLRRTCAEEIRDLRARAVRVDVAAIKRMLHWDAKVLPANDRAKVNDALSKSTVLATIYTMREELAALWQRSNAPKEQLVGHLEDWCARAEASGIIPLQEFSRRLRCYA